ncbi:hypothetical protein [Paraburkholderia sp. J67]|nr:hypothetical protein [Paraburkholderia sp. J67]
MSPSPLIDLTRLQQIPAASASPRASARNLVTAFLARFFSSK